MNKSFYISLILSFAIFMLPPNFKVGVYSLNILGWIWIALIIPLTLVTFVWAGIISIKNKSWQELKLRSIIFICAILITIGYWYFWAYQYGNVYKDQNNKHLNFPEAFNK